MKIPWHPNQDSGEIRPRIFLSASVPVPDRDRRFLSGASEHRLMARVIETRVRDAVTGLVSEVLRRGGQIICGGHPAITPMVASVARDFEVRETKWKPVLLYQSKFFAQATVPVGRAELEQGGLAEVIWVPPRQADLLKFIEDRKILNTARWLNDKVALNRLLQGQADPKANPELIEALTLMRMVICADGRPEAMMCMGGMEGIEGEYKVYRSYLQAREVSPERRIFALSSTYGAAANLEGDDVSVYDREFFTRTQRGEAGLVPETLQVSKDKDVLDRQLLRRVRYDRMMQQFTAELAGRNPLR